MELKIAVCDDEPILCNMLIEKIVTIQPEYKIAVFHSGEQLLLSKETFDIIFLDIEMPGKNGMDIAYELRDQGYKGKIVFLTSHQEYMEEAFNVTAFRYLSKPVSDEKIRKLFFALEKERAEDGIIVVEVYGEKKPIYISEIVYIEADKKKTIIRTLNEEIENANSLKYWTDKLKNIYFIQVHKSYLVSLKHIKNVQDGMITFRNLKNEIPFSRRKQSYVKQELYKYIEENATCL